MAGTVYLKTNRFEVKLEGITFKAKDFEYLCTEDFLFPKGKVWVRRPVVGIDVMHHPRDPSIVLVLLCFGLGCVILRFHSGAEIPGPIHKFLTDERICFVGFGIPEKRELFPFEQLGLTKHKADVGYLAAKFYNSPKYKRCDLGDLARKVLGIRRMVGLADSSSFERHEQIKCGISHLFMSTVIAISLFSAMEKKKVNESPKKSPFPMNLSLLPLTEGWLKMFEGKIREQIDAREKDSNEEDAFGEEGRDTEVNMGNEFASAKGERMYSSRDYLVRAKVSEAADDLVTGEEDTGNDNDSNMTKKQPLIGIFKRLFPSGMSQFNPCSPEPVDPDKETISTPRKPLKGILKCPSSSYVELRSNPSPWSDDSNKEPNYTTAKKPIKGILKCPSSSSMERRVAKPGSPPVTFKEPQNTLKRANSKGHNVVVPMWICNGGSSASSVPPSPFLVIEHTMVLLPKESLDLFLVPTGLLVMFAYHLILLYRYLHTPHTTVIGFENNDKRAWVEKVMQAENKNVSTALDVLAYNNTGATFMATVCLTLSSLIGTWMANNSTIFSSDLIYGDTRAATMGVKYISLLVCFLVGFSCFVQASRNFIHANYLISMPDSDIPISYVESAVIRGGEFWSLGLRALYFAVTLLFWFFGPIPMFGTSMGMVLLLHYLDRNTTPLHRHRSSDKGKQPLMSVEEAVFGYR
nr:uncharacterized protein LOC109158615 [Ipomoea batatas]